MRWTPLLLTLLCLAPPAWADDTEVDDEAAELIKEVAQARFRWRVGASFAVSNGTMLTDPAFEDTMPDEGIVGEFAIRAGVTAPVEGLSAEVRTCWGCHEIELEDAYLQYRPGAWLHVRAGRMNLPLGAANDRHDFSVRNSVSKPLTRIMGNMVRQREFNQGVLPAPYVDNGLNVGGKLGLGGGFRLGWETFVVAGLKGFGNDIDFVASRRFRDVNGEPAVGGRLEVDSSVLTFGASYMWGNYDPDNRRSYQVAAADVRIRAGPVTIQGEIAWRQTEYTAPGADNDEDEFFKYGWWGQVLWEVVDGVALMASSDSLFVTDIFLGANGPTPNEALAVTDDKNRILRFTGGVSYVPYGGIILRANGEYWEFSDFHDVWVIQVGIGWAF